LGVNISTGSVSHCDRRMSGNAVEIAVMQIGAFFMLNLCLVVIATQFAETKRRETESMAAERRRRRRRRRSSSTQASCSAEDDLPDDCYTAIIKYVAHVARRARRRVIRAIRRPVFVQRLEAALGRRRNDPDVEVEADWNIHGSDLYQDLLSKYEYSNRKFKYKNKYSYKYKYQVQQVCQGDGRSVTG